VANVVAEDEAVVAVDALVLVAVELRVDLIKLVAVDYSQNRTPPNKKKSKLTSSANTVGHLACTVKTRTTKPTQVAHSQPEVQNGTLARTSCSVLSLNHPISRLGQLN
jgi:hypothetical protein